MTIITGNGATGLRPPAAARSRPAGAAAFGPVVSEPRTAEPPVPQATAEAGAAQPPPALDGILRLQETSDALTRDRAARRHADAVLEALSALQGALLAGAPDAPALSRLAALADQVPAAADPALAGLVAAVVLRARVELARRERLTSA